VDRIQASRAFEALNRERLHRLIQLAPTRQRLVLELLPFLFHSNNKRLPGFVTDDTPAGIIDYQATKDALDRAQQLDPQFHYRQRALRRYPLRGLYLIHSQSHLSFPKPAEFGLWLLHSPLADEQFQQLKTKLETIVDWAAENGLQLQSRLLSETDLEQGVLSAWERDQFYSCGLVLAGSQPYWWHTSPEEDRDYRHSLGELKQRRQNPVNLVDFGAIEHFSEDELRRLCQSSLKASLVEGGRTLDLHYLSACLQQPASSMLSTGYKQRLYQQDSEAGHFDPDYLKLHSLPAPVPAELYELYYLHSQETLSKTVRQAIYPWRRALMQNLSTEWGWDEKDLSRLDQQTESQPASEQRFVSEGSACNRLLNQIQQLPQTPDSASVLKSLKQLYRLRHQPNLDQIPCLPLRLRPNTDSERLYLSRFANSTQWQLSRMPLSQPSQQPLYSHENLLQVLGYAVANRLLSRSNWLSVSDQQQRVTTASVVELSEQLLKTTLADSDLNSNTQTLNEPETVEQVWLFANLQQTMDSLPQQSLQLSSKQNDPLNYSSFRQSLVMEIDVIIRSSYGLLYHVHFNGEQAPLEMLRHLIAWPPSTQTLCQSWCPTPIFGQAIQQRLNGLVTRTIAFFLHSRQAGRLHIDIAGRSYNLQWQQHQPEYIQRSAQHDLWMALMSEQHGFVAQQLDPYLDRDGLLNTLLSHQAKDRLSVFIYLEHNTIICYLLDEFGNLIRQQYQQLTETTLLAHLHIFLSEIRHRNQIPHLRFYRLQHSQQGWQAMPLAVQNQTKGYLPIRLSMATHSDNSDCEVHCGQHRFHGKANDPALFAQVHTLILSLRKQQKAYPIYLNSLLFEDGAYYPAAVYMKEKNRLEALFNPD
jgi:adenylate cyclase class 1